MPIDLEYEGQIPERAASHLLPFAWGKPRITSLLRSYARECGRVEDAAWELFLLTDVATADLPRLILLGKLIGQAQNALDTEQFRRAIIARAMANRSQGTLGDLFLVLNFLLGELAYSVAETGNATLMITALEPVSDDDIEVVLEVLPAARAGGVGLQFAYSDSADVFVWSDLWGTPEEWGTVISP